MSVEENPSAKSKEIEKSPLIGQKPADGNRTALQMRAESFTGPLPPPELLSRYESMCPGSADRIILLAEREAEHRRSIEQAVVASEVRQRERAFDEARLGQCCALIVTLSAIVAGTYTALSGYEIAGSIIGVGGIGGIVTTFLIGVRAARDTPDPPAPATPRKHERRKK